MRIALRLQLHFVARTRTRDVLKAQRGANDGRIAVDLLKKRSVTVRCKCAHHRVCLLDEHDRFPR